MLVGLTWKPPCYKPIQKLPFVPHEKEISLSNLLFDGWRKSEKNRIAGWEKEAEDRKKEKDSSKIKD